jgi:hypothetical protein
MSANGPNGIKPSGGETANGGVLVGPLGQRYEVKPGQKLEDVAKGMGVRTDDGFGGKGFTGMKVLRGFDKSGNPVTRLVPNSASHSGTGSISFSEGSADGSDSPHGLTFIPNNPAAAVKDVSGNGRKGGGGGGGGGGFTAGDYARMKVAAGIQSERDERQHNNQLELIDVQHRNAKERAEQSSLLGIDASVKKAILNLPPRPGQLQEPAVKTPFATDTSGGETPEVFNKLKSISPELVGMRDSMEEGGLVQPFDNAMTMVMNKIYGNDVVPLQDGQPGSRNLGAIFDSIYQGGSQPAAPAAQDELSGVYEGGGSIFGTQDGVGSDMSMSWLNAPGTESAPVGGESVAANEYASSVGGMIEMFLRNNLYV